MLFITSKFILNSLSFNGFQKKSKGGTRKEPKATPSKNIPLVSLRTSEQKLLQRWINTMKLGTMNWLAIMNRFLFPGLRSQTHVQIFATNFWHVQTFQTKTWHFQTSRPKQRWRDQNIATHIWYVQTLATKSCHF